MKIIGCHFFSDPWLIRSMCSNSTDGLCKAKLKIPQQASNKDPDAIRIKCHYIKSGHETSSSRIYISIATNTHKHMATIPSFFVVIASKMCHLKLSIQEFKQALEKQNIL